MHALLKAAGAEILPGSSLDFVDPWGNRIEVSECRDVQFTKADAVLRAMGLDGAKSEMAREESAAKGMAPEASGGAVAS